jgi:hypothetical protein
MGKVKTEIAFLILALLIALALVAIFSPHWARAAQVDMTFTLPLFRADSTNCQLSSTDTLKNLASVSVYASTTSALIDSAIVLSANVPGMQGKPYAFSVSQPTWTTRWYWVVTRDSLNLRACRSNVFMRTVTSGPPWRVLDLRAR